MPTEATGQAIAGCVLVHLPPSQTAGDVLGKTDSNFIYQKKKICVLMLLTLMAGRNFLFPRRLLLLYHDVKCVSLLREGQVPSLVEKGGTLCAGIVIANSGSSA